MPNIYNNIIDTIYNILYWIIRGLEYTIRINYKLYMHRLINIQIL